MLRALGVWLGTVAGKVVAAFLVVLFILLLWKSQSIVDAAKAKWWGTKTEQGVTHTANADTALQKARLDSVTADSAGIRFDALLGAPDIRNNAGAQKVGASAKTVITAKNFEINNLKTAVKESKAAAKSYQEAGEKPEPRLQPYADIGYAVSLTKKYGVPVVRAGATYRVLGPVNIQGELSYEPPPALSQKRLEALDAIGESNFAKAEIRATVTAHISFR